MAQLSEFLYPLLEVSIIIFLAEVIRTALRRIKLPGLVGELVLGMIISPFLLGGIINTILGIELFSLNNYLLFLSEFSVILLVFAAGLEHGISPLRSAGIYGFLAATFGALLPFITAFLFYQNSLGLTQSLVLGTALGATSLAAVSSIIYEKKIVNNIGASFLLTAAAIDDVIDLILLSVVLGIALSTVALSTLEVIRIISFYSISWLIIFIFSIIIIPRIFNKIREEYTEEITFLILFSLIAIMVTLGFSSVIAAFIAGISIAESIKKEKVAHLVEVLLPIFGPIFFVSIGMQINLTQINPETLLLALELTGIAFLFKIVGIFPFALAKTKDLKNSIAISIGMTPRGEMGLVVASIGGSLGLLGNEELASIVLMAIFTTIIGASIFNKIWSWLK
ncbi:MAG: cation:proton antiporter [Sulfolobaceae archaeon]